MISTDFAPIEAWDDALISLSISLKPWNWKKGKAQKEVKSTIQKQFFGHTVHLFLSGRAGLFHVLQSLNLSANSEIIVQAFTCEAVILPIMANNLKPVYADIEDKTFSLDPVALEKKISNKTKVVVLQHTFGLTPLYRTKIQSIIKEHNLLLIEDIAHGYNQKINSKSQIPNSKSIFLMSFGRSKAISSVFGGAIVTNIPLLRKKLLKIEKNSLFPTYGFILRLLLYKPISFLIKSTYDLYIGKLIHKFIRVINLLPHEITVKEKGGAYDQLLDKSYPNALAQLLSHQFNKYEQLERNRALICSIYQKNFKNLHLDGKPLLRYPVLINNPTEVLENAAKMNLFLGSWYNQVVAPKSVDLKRMKYEEGSCPVAEQICKKIINLPTNVSYQEALKVVNLFQ